MNELYRKIEHQLRVWFPLLIELIEKYISLFLIHIIHFLIYVHVDINWTNVFQYDIHWYFLLLRHQNLTMVVEDNYFEYEY
jgi:hypothetical protein